MQDKNWKRKSDAGAGKNELKVLKEKKKKKKKKR